MSDTGEPQQPEELDYEQVRRRAFQLWEQAGRPGGHGNEFWFQAEDEARQQATSSQQAEPVGAPPDPAAEVPKQGKTKRR